MAAHTPVGLERKASRGGAQAQGSGAGRQGHAGAYAAVTQGRTMSCAVHGNGHTRSESSNVEGVA